MVPLHRRSSGRWEGKGRSGCRPLWSGEGQEESARVPRSQTAQEHTQRWEKLYPPLPLSSLPSLVPLSSLPHFLFLSLLPLVRHKVQSSVSWVPPESVRPAWEDLWLKLSEENFTGTYDNHHQSSFPIFTQDKVMYFCLIPRLSLRKPGNEDYS